MENAIQTEVTHWFCDYSSKTHAPEVRLKLDPAPSQEEKTAPLRDF